MNNKARPLLALMLLAMSDKTYPVRISNSSLFCQRIRAGANKLYLNNTPVTDTASYNKICG
ncbi:hypothetical protein D3C87_347310 [compost metagenome]